MTQPHTPDALIDQDPETRAEYCFQLLLDKQPLWGLEGQLGWVMLSAEGDACTPLFPDAQSAQLWCAQQYPESKPKMIPFAQLQQTLFSQWQQDEVLLMLFPLAQEEEGIMVKVEELLDALAQAGE
ncbi:DUF2750 domain-containing protein [Bowmanella yangjiangensis]|uniref:DUF2750 domain-containing protein n=1 Tax=Bowmanella yangjiangensis TaxID=2811230 RepID=A0ABS3CTR9_9ALTE|nr:DUF2750 domain-containing protein [Bowmanella yangjiangensis]MBN7820005.1 DUF2750 domain-containing protein [Bowmanella yangjiangensis]